jgi:homoserine/homoserine lactone efflux protein
MQVRVAMRHFRKRGGEVGRAEGKRHGDPQAATQPSGREDRFPRRIDLGAGPGRMVPERRSRLGERGAAGRPREKLGAEFRLDPEEPPADDRLGDAEPARGGRNPPGIGHGDECLQILDVHSGVPRFATQLARVWHYLFAQGNGNLIASSMSASPKDARMELPAYLTFLFVSATQAATPGPSVVFIVNNAIAYGWRRALAALSGDLVAIALLATLSIIGLGALLMAYPAAFLSLRLAGATSIIWLGWAFLRPGAPQADPAALAATHVESRLGLWLHSFGVGISNPKAILFFAALFPQFLPVGSGPSVLALLVATFVVVKLIVLGAYAFGARHFVRLLRNPSHAWRGRMLTGIIFVAFGALMIWSALTAPQGATM